MDKDLEYLLDPETGEKLTPPEQLPPPEPVDEKASALTQLNDLGSRFDAGAAPEPEDRRTRLQNQRDEKINSLLNQTGQQMAGDQAQEAKIVSTRPDWYGGGAPPKMSTGKQVGRDILSTLLSIPAATSQVALSNPYTPMRMKYDAARTAAVSQGAGNLVQNLFNKPQTDAAQELDTASKQAQMYKTLSPRLNGRTGNDALGVLRALQSETRIADNEAKEQDRLAERAELRDPESKRSRSVQELFVKSGIIAPEDASKYSGEYLLQNRTNLMQAAAQKERGTETDRKFDMQRYLQGEKAETEQKIQAAKEQRAEEQRKAESFIPGYEWLGHPPSPQAVKETRDLIDNKNVVVNGAHRLKEIQDQLNKASAAAGMFGDYHQYISDAQEKRLLAEARVIKENIDTAKRVLYDMGVPTGKELEYVGATNPQAGSLKGFFLGPAQWDAMGEYFNQQANDKILQRGAHKVGEPLPEGMQTPSYSIDRAPEDQVVPVEKPAIRRYGEKGAAAGEPSSPQAPAQQHIYRIHLKSGVVERPLSEKAAQGVAAQGVKVELVQ